MTATLRRLLGHAWGYKGYLVVGLLTTLLSTLSQLAFPVMLMFIINYVLLGGHESALFLLVIGLLGNELLNIGFGTIRGYSLTMLANQVMIDLRQQVVVKVHRVPLEVVERTTPGQITSVAMNHVQMTAEIFLSILPGVAGGVLSILCVLPLLLLLNAKLTLFLICCIPVLWFGGTLFYPWIKRTALQLQNTLGMSLEKINQSISGTIDIRKYGQVAWDTAHARRVFESIRDESRNHFIPSMLNGNMRTLIFYIPLAVVYDWAGHGVLHGKWTIGAFIAFIQYFGNLIGPVGGLIDLSTDAQSTLAIVKELYEFLDQPEGPDYAANLGPKAPRGSLDEICIHEIGYKYGENMVFDSFSAIIPCGKVTVITGPNGCGKSTLAAILAGLRSPCAGEIHYGKYSSSDVGLVTHTPYVFEGSIADNVRLGRVVDDSKIVDVCKLTGLHEHVWNLPNRYETVIGPGQSTLSSGQLQRLSLARMLVDPPSILVLDEALSNIDVQSQTHLLGTVKARVHTLIYISHNADLVNLAEHEVTIACEPRLVAST